MRILMLAQFYSPIMGGEERHVKSLCDELVRRGHDVAVATLWHKGLPKFEVDEGIRVYRVKGSMQRLRFLYAEGDRYHAPPFPDPEVVLALRRIIRKEQPEIIHAHNWMVYSYLPLKTWSKAPLVVTLHDYSLACPKKRLMYAYNPCTGPGLAKCAACTTDHYGILKGVPTMLANRAMGKIERDSVDMYVAVSDAIATGNQIKDRETPYRIIPNFVPNDLGEHGEAEHPLLQQLPKDGYLLFVGDLTRDKGIHILLRAYARLKNAPPLVMIGRHFGDTPKDPPPNVHIFNSWPHEAIMQAWCRSSIALAPSVWPEPFGIVVLEAMAAGRPVIATRMGGLTDVVVHGETGLLVPAHEVEALKQAMETLIADPALRDRLGSAGKRRVAMFQARNVVPQIERLYRELLGIETATTKEPSWEDQKGSWKWGKIIDGDKGPYPQ